MQLALLLTTQVRSRFHLVYTRRQKNRLSILSNCAGRTISGFLSRPLSSHRVSKTQTQLIVVFLVFTFYAASFNTVIPSSVTSLNLDAIIINYTLTLKFRAKIKE